MSELLDIVDPIVEATIQRLSAQRFTPDPIAGQHFSRIVSLMSSAYKRHGYILELAILEQLRLSPDFEVWEDPLFQVSERADHIVDTAIRDPRALDGTETRYEISGHRTLQVDAIVFDRRDRSLKAYEIKRGAGLHDAGKRRSILRDLLCARILLRSYGLQRGLDVASVASHIIFYYGQCSIPKPFSLTRDELDEHFRWNVVAQVEEVNTRFRDRLFQILSE